MKIKSMCFGFAMLAACAMMFFQTNEAEAARWRTIKVTNNSGNKLLLRIYFSAKGCSGSYDGRTGVCGLRTKMVSSGKQMKRKLNYWSIAWKKHRASVSCKKSNGKWKKLLVNKKYSKKKVTFTITSTNGSECEAY
jgi:hypothetical protein